MTIIRSLLFAPANRPELLRKFPRYPADAFVIDLEDGTPDAEKSAARDALPALVGELREHALPGRLLVRVNEPGSERSAADVDAALGAGADGIVIPKLNTVSDLQWVASVVARQGRGPSACPPILVGIIEGMAGVQNAPAIAAALPRLSALAFGAEDFIADIGGRRTAEGLEVLYARSRVVLAARAAGIVAIDQATVNIRDDGEFTRDATMGRNLGYGGKICLLPRQVEIANEVFSPSAQEIDRSRRVVAAYDAARAEGRGVIDYEGRMIDTPLLKHAYGVLDLASRLGRHR